MENGAGFPQNMAENLSPSFLQPTINRTADSHNKTPHYNSLFTTTKIPRHGACTM
jgi:hypothetical protein